jgi:hypothetical protein
VRLPVSDDHIVLKEDFPRALERILTSLRGRTDTPSRALMAVLGTKQKWLGPNQRRGVFSKTDILSAGGQQGLDLVLNVTKDLK